MTDFAQHILAWFKQHGRHDLPWQHDATPYRVWVSEIMLQQTQVSTVIPYYARFMLRFPNVITLANSRLDEVLQLWQGLGYYTRARNLHRAAVQIRDQYQGHFPTEYDAVLALPGIGRSTAGAVLSLSLNQTHPILDGNVKRVLARHFGIDGWPGMTRVQNDLWTLAETHTPDDAKSYNQAMMDLGATVCVRRPVCHQCPVKTSCVAYREQRWLELPGKKPKKNLPEKSVIMLMIHNTQQEVLLQRRPDKGVWAELYSLPEFDTVSAAEAWLQQRFQSYTIEDQWHPLKHTFSHYHLLIHPIVVTLNSIGEAPATYDGLSEPEQVWYNDAFIGGIPTPVRILLNKRLSQHYA